MAVRDVPFPKKTAENTAGTHRATAAPMTTEKTFTLDIEQIRKRARQHMKDGAVTAGYKADRETILRLLNGALATELVCILRYKRHHFMSSNLGGIAGFAVTNELANHAAEEQAHADLIAERIVQLGGEPNFDPEGLSARSHAAYVAGWTLTEGKFVLVPYQKVTRENYKSFGN